jgi:hypothetical protein
MDIKPILYTRQDIMKLCQCGYTRACEIFTAVYLLIPEASRIKQHKTALPEAILLNYLNPSS